MLDIFKRKTILIISFVFMLLGLYGVYTNLSYEDKEADIEGELRATATKGYLENKILESISSENFDDVVMYQNLANFLQIELSSETLEEIEKHNDLLSKSWRNTKEFTSGFVTGEADSVVGMSGSVASDMTVVGDLRDLTIEGTKFAKGEEYDEIVLSVAAIGVGLSVSQVASAGTSTPLKIGASIVKIAKKAGKLSKTFLKIVSSKLSRSIDIKRLKKIDFKSIAKVKDSIRLMSKSFKLGEIRKLFGKLNLIKKNTSMMDTVSLLKYVDKPKDIAKIATLSKKFKTNTKAVFKVLGKGAMKGTIKVIKFTTLFIVQLITSIISFFIFIFISGTKLFMIRAVKSRVL